MSKRRYTLEVSEKQAEILVKALDLYTRIGIGQFEEILSLHRESDSFQNNQNQVERLVSELKRTILGLEPNSSFGIQSKKVPDQYRVASDMVGMIRYTLLKDQPETPMSKMSIFRDYPLRWGDEPIVSMKLSNDGIETSAPPSHDPRGGD